MLFVPGTGPLERVASKLRYVKREIDKDTIIQKPTFSIGGSNAYAVQYEPYRAAPSVSVINTHGYCDSEIPRVGKITNHFFEVREIGVHVGQSLSLNSYKNINGLLKDHPTVS